MDDRELVRRLKDGDKTAFDEIYEKYGKYLYRTAYLILNSTFDAEDALQEAFLCCYLKIAELKKEESLKYWLVTIIVRISHKKGKQRKLESPDEFVEERLEETEARGSGNAFDEVLTKTYFAEGIAALPFKYREV